MADKSKLSEQFRHLALRGKKSIENIIMCLVVSVDGVTCVCQPLDLDEAEYVNVRLATEDADTLFLITPAVGSVVGVIPFDDSANSEHIIIMYSGIDTIDIRGNQYGGLVKVQDVVDRLNNIESDINDLKTVFSGFVPVPNDGGAALKTAAAAWYGAALVQTVVSDIENENIKQG
jgi:hypothetical protein